MNSRKSAVNKRTTTPKKKKKIEGGKCSLSGTASASICLPPFHQTKRFLLSKTSKRLYFFLRAQRSGTALGTYQYIPAAVEANRSNALCTT
jgi:hypothetical protein